MIAAIVILLVVLVFAVKGLSDPFFGLLGLITVFEVQPGELYPVLAPLHLERTLAAVVLISFLGHGGKFKFPHVTKRFLWFYGSMIAAIPLAFWVSNSVSACISFLAVVYYHLMLVAMLKTEKEVRKVVLLMIALAAWIGGSADYEYHVGVRQFTMGIDRAEGLTSAGGDPNTLAATMLLTMPLMFMLLQKGNSKWTRLFALAAFALGLVTIVITGSRTVFFAFLFLLFLLVFRRKSNLKFIPVLVVSLPLLWLVIPQQYKARYQSVQTRDEDESYTDRLLSWQGGVRMFLHNPLTGVGPENYTDANGDRYWPRTPRVALNAHSLYFKLIGELGGLGVLAFGAYVFALVRANFALTKRFEQEKADLILRTFPGYCNLTICLLFFMGYSGHNLYRTAWYTMGAITGALSLMATNSAVPNAEPRKRRQPAWLPQVADPVTIEAGVTDPVGIHRLQPRNSKF